MDGAALLAALNNSTQQQQQHQQQQQQPIVKTSTTAFNGEIDSFPLKGEHVTLVPFSKGDHELGSSKLKLDNVVNYAWTRGYFEGQLVATLNDLIAYAIVTPGKREGAVRVLHMNSDQRVLLKGMKGKVKDLAFNNKEPLLACVDEFGNVFVFKIQEKSQQLDTQLLQQINHNSSNEELNKLRVIWCPYLPEEDEPEDERKRMLAVTRNDTAEVIDLDIVTDEFGPGPHNAPDKIDSGRLIIKDKAFINDAAFSPDGTALATACTDGSVRFFQVYMPGGGSTASEAGSSGSPAGPRCLHEWSPHGGKPVSGLFFLDNHKDPRPDAQFWKYAVTGCDLNSELKIWSCETWSCLQTVRVRPSDGGDLAFKAALDKSAKFLLLSDIHRKNVYVLQIREVSQS